MHPGIKGLLGSLMLAAVLAPAGSAQVEPCEAVASYLEDQVGMTAIAEPDTIDDWRTKQMIPGCRVTAAGLTRRSLRDEAGAFYEQLREVGWLRSPDPRDAPGEASLRFRKEGSDCLFNFYSDGLLGTDAELTVDDAAVPGPGQRRYNFLVMCVPAMPAAPRG